MFLRLIFLILLNDLITLKAIIICIAIKKPPSIPNIILSANICEFDCTELPIECHTQHNTKKIKLQISYLSNDVRYEIVGNDLLVTILKLNSVKIRVKVPAILGAGLLTLTTNNVRARIVSKNINE